VEDSFYFPVGGKSDELSKETRTLPENEEGVEISEDRTKQNSRKMKK
jgi:hypothetical protein